MQVIEREPYNVIFTDTISWRTFIEQQLQFSLYRMIFKIKFVYLELSSSRKLMFQILEALQTFPRLLFLPIFLDYLSLFSKPGTSRDACWFSYSRRIILYPSVAYCIHSVGKVKASVSDLQLQPVLQLIIRSLHSKVHKTKQQKSPPWALFFNSACSKQVNVLKIQLLPYW